VANGDRTEMCNRAVSRGRVGGVSTSVQAVAVLPSCMKDAAPTKFCVGSIAASYGQIPLRRLPRNFPVQGSFGEVGVVEFGLYGVGARRGVVKSWFYGTSDTQSGHPFHLAGRRTIVLGSVGLNPDQRDATARNQFMAVIID